uniref:CHHC U11-48K-type domain-containing protein n=1 Tax=Scleropages formosus TaxID=113540 RepID=A0A8C9V145_SCLFO
CYLSHRNVESLRPHVEHSGENRDDDCDPDKLFGLVVFPKCCNNHPKLPNNELRTCPFKSCHLMPSYELSHHVANCIDRQKVKKKWNVPPSTGAYLCCTENWNQEAGTNVTPFIWGISISVIQSSLEFGTSNYLTSACRARRILPWNEITKMF